MNSCALCLVTCCAALASPTAGERAPPDAYGNRTTDTLDGQVRGPDVDMPVRDGVYGRFGGDLDLGIGFGAELVEQSLRGAGRLSLHYFWMAGAYATAAHGAEGEGPDPTLVAVGVDLRPAFIPRWSQNMSQGPALLDLTLDSISLGLGAYWTKPEGAEFGDGRGFEAALGFGVPLFGTADGLWLEPRGVLRWADSERAEPALVVTLAWHAMLLSPWAAR